MRLRISLEINVVATDATSGDFRRYITVVLKTVSFYWEQANPRGALTPDESRKPVASGRFRYLVTAIRQVPTLYWLQSHLPEGYTLEDIGRAAWELLEVLLL